MLRLGKRRGAAAKAVGVSRVTVALHVKDDPEFAAAVDDAEMDVHEQVEEALLVKAKEGNVVAIQVWLYNRLPELWRDRRNLGANPAEAFLASLPSDLARALKPYLSGQVPGSEPAGGGG